MAHRPPRILTHTVPVIMPWTRRSHDWDFAVLTYAQRLDVESTGYFLRALTTITRLELYR